MIRECWKGRATRKCEAVICLGQGQQDESCLVLLPIPQKQPKGAQGTYFLTPL